MLSDEKLNDAYEEAAMRGGSHADWLRAVAEAAVLAEREGQGYWVDVDGVRIPRFGASLSVGATVPETDPHYQHLLDMLGAKNHEDAARIIAGHHARELGGATVPEGLLSADEIGWLRRFAETTEDDGSYDIPHNAIRRLCDIGALSWRGHRRYQITDFGDLVLAAAPRHETPT